jgi:hypothetical protein
MSTTINNFTIETQLTASATTLLSTAGSEKKFISNFVLTNTSTSNVEVTLWVLESSTTATTGSGGNWIVNATIPAGKEKKISALIGHTLGTSQKVQGLAGTASVINVNAAGSTET